ncbi:hypothetical protein B0T24DRAFT_594981 [Lasiosphaeria ovina]|uniref:GRF-like zinc ribbon domain-containing protein n=1 Tax=Lasiosphaeria ovina TaxID=92902 RepID=A0AAE0K6X1_9PEZI|nr:hypothetical protein B0T24DRAFT_594981 [Lasiosphaeria ovina]
MYPVFPLSWPPRCPHCGQPCTHDITKPNNAWGNAGRPYWVCRNVSLHATGETYFAAFDDAVGVSAANPLCWCRPVAFYSRRGANSDRGRREFFSCAVGACRFTRDIGSSAPMPMPSVPVQAPQAAYYYQQSGGGGGGGGAGQGYYSGAGTAGMGASNAMVRYQAQTQTQEAGGYYSAYSSPSQQRPQQPQGLYSTGYSTSYPASDYGRYGDGPEDSYRRSSRCCGSCSVM